MAFEVCGFFIEGFSAALAWGGFGFGKIPQILLVGFIHCGLAFRRP